jgi:hypothetical protein
VCAAGGACYSGGFPAAWAGGTPACTAVAASSIVSVMMHLIAVAMWGHSVSACHCGNIDDDRHARTHMHAHTRTRESVAKMPYRVAITRCNWGITTASVLTAKAVHRQGCWSVQRYANAPPSNSAPPRDTAQVANSEAYAAYTHRSSSSPLGCVRVVCLTRLLTTNCVPLVRASTCAGERNVQGCIHAWVSACVRDEHARTHTTRTRTIPQPTRSARISVAFTGVCH